METRFERSVFQPDTPIFREGEPGDCAYVIQRGCVEITALKGGRSVRLAVLRERDLFGEMALVDDQLRSATATAVAETEVLIISRDRVKAEMERADPLLHMLLRIALDRLRRTSDRVLGQGTDASAPNPPARLPAGLSLTGSGPPTSEDDGEDPAYEEMRERAIGRLKLEEELRRAADNRELELRYQSIVDLSERVTVGFEALLRWRHPDRGLLSPDGFVPVAEDARLIAAIGLWVVEEACRSLVDLPVGASGVEPYVAVNVSVHQLVDPRLLVDRMPELLRHTGCPAERLVFEITESALIEDPEATRDTLGRLRDLGIRIFLDDFGTGYSSLSYLNRFPISAVKLDRSFVAAMLRDSASRSLVGAVADLARQLGLGAVAEGIEEEEQVKVLRELGFRYGQGYLLTAPLETPDEARAAVDGGSRRSG